MNHFDYVDGELACEGVPLTAIAPMTAKIVCQVGEGIAIWAIPCVAL